MAVSSCPGVVAEPPLRSWTQEASLVAGPNWRKLQVARAWRYPTSEAGAAESPRSFKEEIVADSALPKYLQQARKRITFCQFWIRHSFLAFLLSSPVLWGFNQGRGLGVGCSEFSGLTSSSNSNFWKHPGAIVISSTRDGMSGHLRGSVSFAGLAQTPKAVVLL